MSYATQEAGTHNDAAHHAGDLTVGADTALRILAAIVFVDMVGYSALMDRSERQAKVARDRYRTTLDSVVVRYGGEIVQHYGDGALIVFRSAIVGARAARRLQSELGGERGVPVRIGVHMADIVIDSEGAYGTGVNVAARIQALCPPGGVLISGVVNYEIRNQAGIDAVSLGHFALKNIEPPVEICAIAAPGLVVPSAGDIDAEAVSICDASRRSEVEMTTPTGFRQKLSARFHTFWSEAHRRKVDRVAVAYGAASMSLVSFIELFGPAFGMAADTWRVVAVLVSVGFPVALVLSWIFDMSIKVSTDSPTPEAARAVLRIGLAVGGVLAMGAGGWMLGI